MCVNFPHVLNDNAITSVSLFIIFMYVIRPTSICTYCYPENVHGFIHQLLQLYSTQILSSQQRMQFPNYIDARLRFMYSKTRCTYMAMLYRWETTGSRTLTYTDGSSLCVSCMNYIFHFDAREHIIMRLRLWS